MQILRDRHGVSYLHHAVSANDVFTLVLPFRASDEPGTARTRHNESPQRIKLADGTWIDFSGARVERKPDGFIAIRGLHDIDRLAFEDRYSKAVEMGVAWCVLIDQHAHALSVFRDAEIERVESVEGWSLRELPDVVWKREWFETPVS
jgi:hypothetical protein